MCDIRCVNCTGSSFSLLLHTLEGFLFALQECFNSPYGTQYFAEYAETIPGETTNFLSKIAKELKIHLIGGSIPESYDGKLYNTSTVFGPDGTMLGEFRKVCFVVCRFFIIQ